MDLNERYSVMRDSFNKLRVPSIAFLSFLLLASMPARGNQKDWILDTNQTRLTPTGGDGTDNWAELVFFELPDVVAPSEQVACLVVWKTHDVPQSPVVFTNLFGSWAPGTEIDSGISGKVAADNNTYGKMYRFSAPAEEGEYSVRWFFATAFASVDNYYGSEPHGVRDPGVSSYAEASFRVSSQANEAGSSDSIELEVGVYDYFDRKYSTRAPYYLLLNYQLLVTIDGVSKPLSWRRSQDGEVNPIAKFSVPRHASVSVEIEGVWLYAEGGDPQINHARNPPEFSDELVSCSTSLDLSEIEQERESAAVFLNAAREWFASPMPSHGGPKFGPATVVCTEDCFRL